MTAHSNHSVADTPKSAAPATLTITVLPVPKSPLPCLNFYGESLTVPGHRPLHKWDEIRALFCLNNTDLLAADLLAKSESGLHN